MDEDAEGDMALATAGKRNTTEKMAGTTLKVLTSVSDK